MASLTRTAIVVRKIIRYTIYGLITIILIRYTIIIGTKVYRYFFPEPPPPPTVTFGKLPDLPFPQGPNYDELTFILETPDGNLPTLPVQAKTYFMPKPASNIRSLERAQDKAKSLGFNPVGREISDTIYHFEMNEDPTTLTFNIVTNVFSVSYDLVKNPSIIDRTPPAPEIAKENVKSYLAHADLLPDDLSGPETHEFIKVKNGEFVGTVSLSESDMVKIYLFRQAFDEFPSLTLNPKEANIWFIVAGGKERRRAGEIIAGEYHYFPLDVEKSSTYPLKTSQEAWDDLKSGKGYVARLGYNQAKGEMRIRRIYLAYLDPGVYTEFFQPIVVFEGDNEFTAYVTAIANEYYEQDESEEASDENAPAEDIEIIETNEEESDQ